MERLFMYNKLVVVKLWFKKAENDLSTIKNNLKSSNPPTDAICFHAQQAIEKYIKGALINYEIHFSKTHDLVNLMTSIVKHFPELSSYEEDLEEISHYGVEIRYPDSFYEPTLMEAKKAYNTARRIKKLITNKIPTS